jgi:hypothetical protein
MTVQPQGHHLAHFNWATLVADLDDPRVAPFVNAVEKVNAIAERSAGFVWRSGDESAFAVAAGWPLFVDAPRIIASFSVWERPEDFRAFVYKTVHGAFYRRGHEWFEPEASRGYVLWWVPEGHVPGIAEARDRVERHRAQGAGPDAFDIAWLEAQAV